MMKELQRQVLRLSPSQSQSPAAFEAHLYALFLFPSSQFTKQPRLVKAH